MVLMVIVFHRNLQRKQREAFRHVLDAVEKERQRIGQDLHDDIGPMLGGLKLGLNALTPMVATNNDIAAILLEQKKVISQALTAIRESAHELTPRTLLRYGLIQAIDERCTQITKSGQWLAKLSGTYFPQEINRSNALSIFRILTELMHNSIKHSGGTEILISFDQAENYLVITYSDNGKGMNSSEESTGLGLSGIKTRIQLMRGTYEAKSSPGHGFIATIKFKTENLS